MGIPAPASTAEAMDMVLTGLSYLAAGDPAALAAEAQAECLQAFEQADAISAAARARILAAFTAGQGYSDDADYSPTSWLIHRTRVTKGAARGHLGWARRAATHPQVVAALAEGTVLAESMARALCGWTDQLPAGCREAADGILVAAARAGPARRTWPRWPPRSTPAPGPGTTRTRSRASRTGGCGWRPRSPGAGVICRGPDPGVRGGGDGGAGGAVGPAGRGGHPDPGAALP